VRLDRCTKCDVVSVAFDTAPLGGGVVPKWTTASVGSLVVKVTSALLPVTFVIWTFVMTGPLQSTVANFSTRKFGVPQ